MASTLKVTEITTPDGTGNITVSRPLTGGTGVKGGDIASASPLVIDTDGDYFDVTGTTNFAAMTVAADRQFTLQFDGVLTMTHHATNLDLPGEANITTAAGDVGVFQSTGANTVQCISYTKADGTGVVSAGGNKTIFLIAEYTETQTVPPELVNQRFVNLSNGVIDNTMMVFTPPDDFTAITSATMVISPAATGNAVLTITGEARNDGDTHSGGTSDSIAETTYAGTAVTLDYVDITAAVNGLTVGTNEIVQIKVKRAGADGSDTIDDAFYVSGVFLVYS